VYHGLLGSLGAAAKSILDAFSVGEVVQPETCLTL